MKRRFIIASLFMFSLSPLFCALDFTSKEPSQGENFTLPLSLNTNDVYTYEVGFSSTPVSSESETVGRIDSNAFRLATMTDDATGNIYGSLSEGAYIYWKIISPQSVKIYVALENKLSYTPGTSSGIDEIDWALSWDGENSASTLNGGSYTYEFTENNFVHYHSGKSGNRDIGSVKLTIKTEKISPAEIGNHYAQRYEANIMIKVKAE